MTSGLRGVAVGALCALRVPAHLSGRKLGALVAPGPVLPRLGARDAAAAVRAARAGVRLLARLPGSRWRNTCLFRAAAECLALRRCGVPARLRLGVRPDDGGDLPVAAHAWVERGDGGPTGGEASTSGRYRPLGRVDAA